MYSFFTLFLLWFSFFPLSLQAGPIPSNSSTKEQGLPINNMKIDWWLVRAKNHELPGFNTQLSFKLEDYDALCLGDTSRKVIYLTFDEGYENGYTPQILDILKAKNVPAMFFVTDPYLTQNPAIITRMTDEGHLVVNHSVHHPSMPSIANDLEKFKNELLTVATHYKEITGKEMPPFFRPPMGHYSERSLALTQQLGYKTVFWSFAYADWDPKKQPEPSHAKTVMVNGLHNGAIYLLHAVSKTNTEVLDPFIDDARSLGYTFELLPY
ncbi:delta-lactam-biosynthetic de-N-acetylase [Sporanaerobium hydrogeniformans]|uniref:Delta-lactam-biosynthetic de-N-acetylase n=1 Tax=Sporanaerobium hydrogeniformans TaxID=3072179 RepID=A0AC61DEE1_9FIRM|nr:delta-lactam-biosynthetic de-N-acetylase [Sporanaerobium hydrogeniformans]PHV71433.1 delta-lactam-biosynthetic de-N-acetylase [Sporanaerobium hydrogeniformans]